MPQRAELRLICEELDDSKLQSLTRDLARSLNDEGLKAVLPTEGHMPGGKGIPLDINGIILAFIGSGGVAVGLIQVLKAYVERKTSIQFEVVRSDGQKLLLNIENLGPKQQEKTMQVVETFLKN